MDRFGDTAKRSFDFLKSRALDTVEAQKINANLRKLEERRERCLVDIGHRVNVMFDLPEFDREAVRDRVEELRHLTVAVEQARAELDALAAKHRKESRPAGGIPTPDYMTDED